MERKQSPEERYEDHSSLTGGPNSAPARPTFKQKLANHFKRFWWLHLAVFVIVGLLITLLLIFVGFPRIAQSDVNNAKLNLTSQIITNPTPDSVHIELHALIKSSSPFHPTLDSFPAVLYLPDSGPDKPFGNLTMPSVHSTGETPATVNQTLQITDMNEFIKYNQRTLMSTTYEVAMKGRTKLHLGSLPVTTVTFQKTLNVTGLNALKSFKVEELHISLTPAADGSNVNGTVYVGNPSVYTLTFGNVTLNLAVDNQSIGTSTLENVVLKPGDNHIPMRGVSDETLVINLITSKYKDGILPVTTTGNSTIYNGQDLEYFAIPLRNDTLQTQLDVGKALAELGINVTALGSAGGGLLGGGGATTTSLTSSTSAGGFGTPSSSAGGLGLASSSSSAVAFPTAETSSAPAETSAAASSSASPFAWLSALSASSTGSVATPAAMLMT